MFGWGMSTMLLGAVNNFAGLVILRFLLGTFEGGLFPGIIYCLTFWYKQDERALRAALIVGCATLGKHVFRCMLTIALNYPFSRGFRWGHRLRSRAHGQTPRSRGMEVAFHHRRCTFVCMRYSRLLPVPRLPRNEPVVVPRGTSYGHRKDQRGCVARTCEDNVGGCQGHSPRPTDLPTSCRLYRFLRRFL